MKINFENDITNWLDQQNKRTIMPDNIINIPSSQELYFEGKLNELLRQYQTARVFLSTVDNPGWDYWYKPFNDEIKDGLLHIQINEMMLETSIIYYNIVVDLSWVLCYVTAEYTFYQKEKILHLDDINPIKDTKDVMREMEKFVSNPSTKDNPLDYIKQICPEYSQAIDLVYDYWNVFGQSEVRKLYNFIKHRGKPQYKEIYKYTAKKFISFHKDNEEYPTDINDVKLEISLYDTVALLEDYDNKYLFPYCDKLFSYLIPLVYKEH